MLSAQGLSTEGSRAEEEGIREGGRRERECGGWEGAPVPVRNDSFFKTTALINFINSFQLLTFVVVLGAAFKGCVRPGRGVGGVKVGSVLEGRYQK